MDSIDDDTDMIIRKRYFEEEDVGEIGVIDFEGYLNIIAKLRRDYYKLKYDSGKFHVARSRRQLRRMSVEKKLKIGLF